MENEKSNKELEDRARWIADKGDKIYHEFIAVAISDTLLKECVGHDSFINLSVAINIALNQVAVDRMLDLIKGMPDRMLSPGNKKKLVTSIITGNLKKLCELKESMIENGLWDFSEAFSLIKVTGDKASTIY